MFPDSFFSSQHPEILGPLSSFGFGHLEVHLNMLNIKEHHIELTGSLQSLIIACRRKLEEYDQLVVLNLPLQRDVILPPHERFNAQQKNSKEAEMTDSEERKFVFQQLFRAYYRLLFCYTTEDSPTKSDVLAKRHCRRQNICPRQSRRDRQCTSPTF